MATIKRSLVNLNDTIESQIPVRTLNSMTLKTPIWCKIFGHNYYISLVKLLKKKQNHIFIEEIIKCYSQ